MRFHWPWFRKNKDRTSEVPAVTVTLAPNKPPLVEKALFRKSYLIIAGFDFGTSFSKVVIREQAQKIAETVTYGDGQWLFPSLIGYKDGKLFAPLCANLEGPLPYLKMLLPQVLGRQDDDGGAIPESLAELLQGQNQVEVMRDLLAWFFANVLAATREHISKRSHWQDWHELIRRDKLLANVCIPVGIMNDRSASSDCLHDAFCLGFLLSRKVSPSMDEMYGFADWRNACADLLEEITEVRDKVCFTFPEVAAGVQSVFRSPTAEDGLYITMDVGAGTVDMNAFRRHTAQRWQGVEDRPNNLDYYAAKVSAYGVARIAEAQHRNPFELLSHVNWDRDAQLVLKPLLEEDLAHRVATQVEILFGAAKLMQRNLGSVEGSKTWDSCRVYAWGGGYEYRAYPHALTEGLKNCGLSMATMRLPAPQDLSLPMGADYQRLSIAYGLSFFIADLGVIRLPEDVPVVEPVDHPSRFPRDPSDQGYFTSPTVAGENPLYD